MNRPDSELSAALRRLPAPAPSADLLPRILRSRAMGVRIADEPKGLAIPWRWLAAAAVTGVLIGGSWMVSLSLSRLGSSPEVREPLDAWLRQTGMLPSDSVDRGLSGEVPRPKYGLITTDDLDVTRLTEGTWMYAVATTTDNVLTQPSGRVGIRLVRAHHLGQPVLMVNEGRDLIGGPWGEYADTTHLDPVSLRPLRSVASGRRTRFIQTFSGDSGYESILRTGPMAMFRASWAALPFSRQTLFVNDWSTTRLAVLFGAFPLARRWSGSLYQVAYITQNPGRSSAPIDLRVVGTDRVTVPAGTFDCWRVEVDTHLWRREREAIWVSRDKGWVIKRQTHGPDFVVNTVLESYEPGR